MHEIDKCEWDHYYELTLRPTPTQVRQLEDLLQASLVNSITGSGIVTPLAAGWLEIQGVSGAVRAGTDWDRQLPPWAQAVLGREYASAGRQLPIPALASAWRVDWAAVCREDYGWTVELAFHWADLPPSMLMCGVDTGGEEREVLRMLMGDGSQVEWPTVPKIPQG